LSEGFTHSLGRESAGLRKTEGFGWQDEGTDGYDENKDERKDKTKGND
jgi:hypothetical protein